MVKISLCMVVKNEAANLAACLTSVQNLVTEMIILDTGSEDQTKEIAKDHGALVYDFVWVNHFSAARNQALEYAQGDWILVLDGDEVFNPEVIPQLQPLLADPQNLVINLVRQEVGAVQSPYSLVSRLFRRHPQLHFTRPYHSLIDDSVLAILASEPHWQIKQLESVSIYHYGYQPEAIQALDKYQRAQAMMESFWREHPEDPYICSKLGALYLQIGEVEKGIKLLQTGLQTQEPPVLFELHYHLGNAYSRLKQPEIAANHYQQAIAQPILPKLKLGAYHNFGSLCQTWGDLENAQKLYKLTLQIDPQFALGYYNLGMNFKRLGDYKGAISAYQKAIELAPNYPYSYQNLGVILWKLGQVSESVTAFKQAIALHQISNPEEGERLSQGLINLGINLEK